MSRNLSAALGARKADASNTCVGCGGGVPMNNVDWYERDEFDNTHHYDNQGEKVAVSVGTPTATNGKRGLHCTDCAKENASPEAYAESRSEETAMRNASQSGSLDY